MDHKEQRVKFKNGSVRFNGKTAEVRINLQLVKIWYPEDLYYGFYNISYIATNKWATNYVGYRTDSVIKNRRLLPRNLINFTHIAYDIQFNNTDTRTLIVEINETEVKRYLLNIRINNVMITKKYIIYYVNLDSNRAIFQYHKLSGNITQLYDGPNIMFVAFNHHIIFLDYPIERIIYYDGKKIVRKASYGRGNASYVHSIGEYVLVSNFVDYQYIYSSTSQYIKKIKNINQMKYWAYQKYRLRQKMQNNSYKHILRMIV